MAKALVASFLVILLAAPIVFATDYNVGDSTGWALGGDYSTWVSGKTFKVGDNLVFKYDTTHQVDVVDENGYKSCSSSNVLKNYQDGNSKVPLTTTGKMYFICPTPGHCNGGMKLEINVVAASTTPTSGSPPPTTTPSGGSPPKTPSTPSPPSESGTPATTSAPSPKDSGAVSISSGISHLMGSLVLSAIILGFMG